MFAHIVFGIATLVAFFATVINLVRYPQSIWGIGVIFFKEDRKKANKGAVRSGIIALIWLAFFVGWMMIVAG